LNLNLSLINGVSNVIIKVKGGLVLMVTKKELIFIEVWMFILTILIVLSFGCIWFLSRRGL